MSEVSTLEPEDRTRPPVASERNVTRRRGLPGGRAVVGAFLVAAAAVGIFGAYLSATAAPTTRYVVAARDLPIGSPITSADLDVVALDLPPAQAQRAISEAQAPQLADYVVVGPVSAGDLLTASQVAETTSVDRGTVLSFSLPRDRSLAGTLSRGEKVDVIATFAGTGGQSFTEVVARAAEVLQVSAGDGGLSGEGTVFVVEVGDLAQAQRLIHALDVAQVALVQTGDADTETPRRYRPSGD